MEEAIQLQKLDTLPVLLHRLPLLILRPMMIIPPLVKNLDFTLDRIYKPSLSEFELDMNNELVQREDLNAPEGVGDISINGRNPEGRMNPDLMLPSEYNIWEKLSHMDTLEIKGTIGRETAKTIHFAIPKAVFTSLELGEREGVRVANIKFGVTGCDDEFWLYYF